MLRKILYVCILLSLVEYTWRILDISAVQNPTPHIQFKKNKTTNFTGTCTSWKAVVKQMLDKPQRKGHVIRVSSSTCSAAIPFYKHLNSKWYSEEQEMTTRPAELFLLEVKFLIEWENAWQLPAKTRQDNTLEKQQDGERVQFKPEFAFRHKCGVIHHEYSNTRKQRHCLAEISPQTRFDKLDTGS